MSEEIWKPIQGYESIYEISNLGKVKSIERKTKCGKGFMLRKEKILKESTNSRGYKYVSLKGNKSKVTHRLVAEAFIPREEHQTEVNHKNGIKTDNRLENLEWVTHKENIQHAHKLGLKSIARGEKSCNAILTNEQAKEIRNLHEKEGLNMAEIARRFKVSYSTVFSIIKRKTYLEVE